MDLLQWIGLGIAALAGGFTALARIYRFGPFLDKIEPMPSTDRIPEDTDFVPASPPPVMAPSEPELPLVAPLAPKTGKIWSTDWGLVQVNDTKNWHIGKGLRFSSVEDVLTNPEKAVRWVIDVYRTTG